jgi:hypothetical protein
VWQCGQGLEYWIAFLGSESECLRGWFTEPAMHLECASFARSVCPYLSKGTYKDRLAGQDEKTLVLFDWMRVTGSRQRWGMYITRQYKVVERPQTALTAKAAPAKQVEWF